MLLSQFSFGASGFLFLAKDHSVFKERNRWTIEESLRKNRIALLKQHFDDPKTRRAKAPGSTLSKLTHVFIKKKEEEEKLVREKYIVQNGMYWKMAVEF